MERSLAVNIQYNPLAMNPARRSVLKGLFLSGCGAALSEFGLKSCVAASGDIPAKFWLRHEDKTVECQLCFRGCILAEGETGHCEVRINRSGTLYALSYGQPGAMHIDPIEKKPFFHFLPGTTAFSIGAVGCNIDCKFCQNWQLAQAKPGEIQTEQVMPGRMAAKASAAHCPTVAYTYSEPTVWAEYVIDCAREASKLGIRSVVVSNGTIQKSALEELLPCLKAYKIDLKSIDPQYYRSVCNAELAPVLDTILSIKKSGVWLELVNLVVTTLNDTESSIRKLSQWVKSNLGTDVPLHFTRFHPMYQLLNLASTSLKTLDMAYEIAQSEGLKYVYVGNVPGHKAQNTFCPSCNKLLIERSGFTAKRAGLENGYCAGCKAPIPGIWT